MSTKDLSRTVIEGGRTRRSRFERRHSHGVARAHAHVLAHQLCRGRDAEKALFYPRKQASKYFSDKLGPARRWLQSQAGRPWDHVRSELFARFDIRTTAGRHIVFDHLLREVLPAPSRSWQVRELWISPHGILRFRPLARKRRRDLPLAEPESVLLQWLAGRRVLERDAHLYWLVATPQQTFRQDQELTCADAARFRALPAWFRQRFAGPLRPEGSTY